MFPGFCFIFSRLLWGRWLKIFHFPSLANTVNSFSFLMYSIYFLLTWASVQTETKLHVRDFWYQGSSQNQNPLNEGESRSLPGTILLSTKILYCLSSILPQRDLGPFTKVIVHWENGNNQNLGSLLDVGSDLMLNPGDQIHHLAF
jgi:hypothetical protein